MDSKKTRPDEKSGRVKQIYAQRKGLAAVTRWVRLKYADMNLKKLAHWSWNNSFFLHDMANICSNIH